MTPVFKVPAPATVSRSVRVTPKLPIAMDASQTEDEPQSPSQSKYVHVTSRILLFISAVCLFSVTSFSDHGETIWKGAIPAHVLAI